MKKIIVLTIVGTLVVVAGLFAAAVLMFPQLSNPLRASGQPAPASGPGYGPGMMGGRGPMRGGPGASGTPVVPPGYTPPSGRASGGRAASSR